MCFFNSFTAKALSLANRYSRKKNQQLELFDDKQFVVPAYAHPNSIIINLDEEPQIMEWGLIPSSAKVADMERYRKGNWFVNAKAETIFETWPYKLLIHNKRCIIPSTGFYEYHYETVNGKEESSVYRIFMKGEEIFSIGGLYDRWINTETGQIHDTYVMITTEANERMKWIHNGGKNPFRMPFMIPKELEEIWLDSSLSERDIKKIMQPLPENLMDDYEVDKKTFRGDPHNPGIIDPKK